MSLDNLPAMTADIHELFERTLSDNYEDETAWKAVHTLCWIGTSEVFEKAAQWCESDIPMRRARGADVLAQIGKTQDHPTNSFPEAAWSVMEALAQRETEPQPLAAAIAALGHIGNPAAIPLIALHHSHPDADVRFDVAFALGCFPNEASSISILVELTQDLDKDVRDWATFGLGVLGDSDSAQIRDALVLRLSDSDKNVREEAMVGLAKRHDQRVLPTLLTILKAKSMSIRPIEAACFLLGPQSERQDWDSRDYCAALEENFSLKNIGPKEHRSKRT